MSLHHSLDQLIHTVTTSIAGEWNAVNLHPLHVALHVLLHVLEVRCLEERRQLGVFRPHRRVHRRQEQDTGSPRQGQGHLAKVTPRQGQLLLGYNGNSLICTEV